MADEADSKSVARDGVWVQVPPPAPGFPGSRRKTAAQRVDKVATLSEKCNLAFPGIQDFLGAARHGRKSCREARTCRAPRRRTCRRLRMENEGVSTPSSIPKGGAEFVDGLSRRKTAAVLSLNADAEFRFMGGVRAYADLRHARNKMKRSGKAALPAVPRDAGVSCRQAEVRLSHAFSARFVFPHPKESAHTPMPEGRAFHAFRPRDEIMMKACRCGCVRIKIMVK